MANTLSKSGIENSQTILAKHVTQSVDALTGVSAYDITISGSLTLTGSVSSLNGYTGDLIGTASWAENAVSANTVTTASYALTALSSSYALSGSHTVSASHAGYANTASVVENYIDGTRNFTTISPQGTIYTKYEDVFMSQSAVDEYDLLAAITTFTGDRTIPSQFAQANTTGEVKAVKFYINGFLRDPGGSPNIDAYVKIGSTILNGTQLGSITIINNSDGPFEIDGELIFTNNAVRPCVGLGYCNDNNQDYYKFPLSNLYTPTPTAGLGGALQFIVSGSSNLEMTASYARIEFVN